VSQYLPVARTLFTLASSGQSTTLTTSGNSQVINLTEVTDVWLTIYAAGTSTGTSPTLTVNIDGQDAVGNWFANLLFSPLVLTAAPNLTSGSLGLHMPNTAAFVLPAKARITWTLGGTNPAFPNVSICMIGR
jgi:hypothetical protein